MLASPAELAAERALSRLFTCLDERRSFRFEAGAGAGKTYSLVEALRRLLRQKGAELVRCHRQIACITFTNVARNEIVTRTAFHPAVRCDTVHGFSWGELKNFQPLLRDLLPSIDGWAAELEKTGGVGGRRVVYELGFMSVDDDSVTLRHDDVPRLMAMFLAEPKFRAILAARYPYLLIDEYQDTDKDLIQAIKDYLLEKGPSPVIGFFGDHWQRIYGTRSCGTVEHAALEVIKKEANFRSAPAIVDCLNRMRPDLPQMVCDPEALGEVHVMHTNAWVGVRRSDNPWSGDAPPGVSHRYLQLVRSRLESAGWEFAPETTKILMLTHSVLASEQGYPTIPRIFPYSEAYVKKEDAYIGYFVDVLEPTFAAYETKRYGEMFATAGVSGAAVRSLRDKARWATAMDLLLALRAEATAGSLLDAIRQLGVLPLSDAVERRERELRDWLPRADEVEPSSVGRARALREVPYREIVALARYIDGQTPFSTKHGVKGAEFENVLVVLGRGWSQYNFEQFLVWAGQGGPPAGKEDAYERNRNLFYVVSSRPKRRLALLFTQSLSSHALATLASWFGPSAIEALPATV